MKYVLLSTENRVVEIIPEFNPAFPEIPITKRYTEVFVDSLIEVSDDVEVAEGFVYNFESGTFSEYVEPEIIEEEEVTWDIMAAAITEGVNEV